MTQYTYEQARNIKEQIAHIDEILKLITYDYECEPPTRRTEWTLIGNQGRTIDLNEGEIVLLKTALLRRKDTLYKEFNDL